MQCLPFFFQRDHRGQLHPHAEFGEVKRKFRIQTCINLFSPCGDRDVTPVSEGVCQIWRRLDKLFGRERRKTRGTSMPSMFEIWQWDCRLHKYTKFDVPSSYSLRDTAGFSLRTCTFAQDEFYLFLIKFQTASDLYCSFYAPRAVI